MISAARKKPDIPKHTREITNQSEKIEDAVILIAKRVRGLDGDFLDPPGGFVEFLRGGFRQGSEIRHFLVAHEYIQDASLMLRGRPVRILDPVCLPGEARVFGRM